MIVISCKKVRRRGKIKKSISDTNHIRVHFHSYHIAVVVLVDYNNVYAQLEVAMIK